MRFRHIMGAAAAFLFAALAPALVAAILAPIQLTFIIFAIALGHAVVLGLPLFLLLRWKRWVNFFSCIAGGFVVGIVPIGILTWPLHADGGRNASIGFERTPIIVDGVPTLAGWLQYAKMLAYVGAFGALAGLVFWLVLKWLGGRDRIGEADAASGPWRMVRYPGVLLVIAVLLSGAVLSIPTVTKDRSCHNMLRDGRASIGTEVNIDLQIEIADWDELTSVLTQFATEQGLSFRNDSRSDPGVVFIVALSLCNDEGTNILVNEQRWSIEDFEPVLEGRGVGIGVYAAQEGAAWTPLARQLVIELESIWPGKVLFRGPDGRVIAKPAVLN